MLIKIKQENRWLKLFLANNEVDVIISDNRFGFYSRDIPSVFITHQLGVKTGIGAWADKLAQWLNYRRIGHFSACWVADKKGAGAVAGALSNPKKLPVIPLQYLGIFSRFHPCKTSSHSKDLLIIISGPEPQRSIFEKKLLTQIGSYRGTATIVRGLPGEQSLPTVPDNITVYNHVAAQALNQLICEAELVISRTGYTTVMDLIKAGKKSILVPTPGQPEQEYLGAYLKDQQIAFTLTQNEFSLIQALEEATRFSYRQMPVNMEEYKIVIKSFIASLSSASK